MKSISLTNFVVKHGSKIVFSETNLLIPEEKYILKGPNGCGKSTFLRVLSGLQNPTKGSIKIDFPSDLVSESIKFPGNMNVQAIFSLYERYRRLDIYLRDELLESFSLKQYLLMNLNSLSQGSQQKIRLILGLSGKGSWLFLDEPFNGLDTESVILLNDIITRIDRPIILVDHSNQSQSNCFSEIQIKNKKLCIN